MEENAIKYSSLLLHATFSFFYKVDDRYETMLDKKGFSVAIYSTNREGKYSNDFAAEFDQLSNVAVTKAGRYSIRRMCTMLFQQCFMYEH